MFHQHFQHAFNSKPPPLAISPSIIVAVVVLTELIDIKIKANMPIILS
jgi:hypothetical protein